MTGQPVLNPRKEKRKEGSEGRERENDKKREREREMGGGEREREEDCLFSAPRSHAQIIVNAAGKKKKSPGWA